MKVQSLKPLAIALMLALVPLSVSTVYAGSNGHDNGHDNNVTRGLLAEIKARKAADANLQAQIDDIAPAGLMIGDVYGGGKVIYLNADGTHGLVAATQNQGSFTWWDAQDAISNPANHNAAGQAFTDWRLPTKHELNFIGVRPDDTHDWGSYWSSTEVNSHKAWYQFKCQCLVGGAHLPDNKSNTNIVRAVRAF